MEQENLLGKADGSKSHTAFISVIELPGIPAECLKRWGICRRESDEALLEEMMDEMEDDSMEAENEDA